MFLHFTHQRHHDGINKNAIDTPYISDNCFRLQTVRNVAPCASIVFLDIFVCSNFGEAWHDFRSAAIPHLPNRIGYTLLAASSRVMLRFRWVCVLSWRPSFFCNLYLAYSHSHANYFLPVISHCEIRPSWYIWANIPGTSRSASCSTLVSCS